MSCRQISLCLHLTEGCLEVTLTQDYVLLPFEIVFKVKNKTTVLTFWCRFYS